MGDVARSPGANAAVLDLTTESPRTSAPLRGGGGRTKSWGQLGSNVNELLYYNIKQEIKPIVQKSSAIGKRPQGLNVEPTNERSTI